MNSLTVIVEAGTGAEHLPDCLAALLSAQTCQPFELLVAAGENTPALSDSFHVVKHCGTPGARLNAAAKETSSDFLLFIRPWIVTDAKAVSALLESVGRDMSIACACPLLLAPNGTVALSEFILIQDECKRRPIDVLLKPADPSRKEDWPLPPHDGIAFIADALLIRKVAFWGAGGWDEGFVDECLDLTLGLALKEQNWRCVLEQEAVMITCRPPTEPKLSIEATQNLVRRWFGRFLPHGFRTSDGTMRGHPWWPPGSGTLPAGYQRAEGPFNPLPTAADYVQGDIPGERCAVVIVTYNSMESIGACLTSVLENLGTFDELVVIDNASRDETPQFLRGIENTDPRLKVILNDKNLGFSAASNIGIEASSAEYVVLLNPDTVVIEGWLGRMREYFSEPSVGAVGPISNGVCGLQGYSYHFPRKRSDNLSPVEVHELASQVNMRRGVESKLLIGFCLMLKRSVLAQVGLLDPELFLGCDDLDMSWRLRLAGYRLIIATDVFVLHRVHVSFLTEPVEVTNALSGRSYKAFRRKLDAFYGIGNVPPEAELWGIDWFERTVDMWDQAEARTA